MTTMFKTKINGVTCYCRVDRYQAGRPNKVAGPMEDAEEGYDEEFEYTILDDRCIIAPWLTIQITKEDEERLLEEYHITVLEEKHLYGADEYDR